MGFFPFSDFSRWKLDVGRGDKCLRTVIEMCFSFGEPRSIHFFGFHAGIPVSGSESVGVHSGFQSAAEDGGCMPCFFTAQTPSFLTSFLFALSHVLGTLYLFSSSKLE
jgi:hypothetical protein